MKTLFPEIEPFGSGHLAVSDLHSLYYEQCGQKEGPAVLFLHGGPGGGVGPSSRRFFDPSFYRIVLFDQRGCGKSTPYGELRENTTWDLIADIETLREHLGIERWLVFGGSWGSTLALSYAICHKERVQGLILRGIWLSTERELDWCLRGGAARIYPEAYRNFLSVLPAGTPPEDVIPAYYEIFCHGSQEELEKAARAWSGWEGRISKLCPTDEDLADSEDLDKAVAIAKLECHYFMNNWFGEKDSWILDHVSEIEDLPCFIVNGRYDMVCPIEAADALSRRFRNVQFVASPHAGHAAAEPETTDALIGATEAFKVYCR